MYTFGDIAWTRGRIFTKFLYFFMNFEKSIIFTNFHRFEQKHNVAHLLFMFVSVCADLTITTTLGTSWRYSLDTRSNIY